MKNRIHLGQASSHPSDIISFDLETLLHTRALIQAGSGGGKSWLLRRLAEQLWGKVPVIIIDPEGEYSTLREKFGFVLVGPGGETPADIRSAALVARKMLELKASAVCDLYELQPHERHIWVQRFNDALVDAPKHLWQPMVIIYDEAHIFAPEKGNQESVATNSMVNLISRGRKRGFCPILATQRLGKLAKNAAAELQNVIIGNTFIDLDRARAAETLGITKAETPEFMRDVKMLRPGEFFALGRAIARERVQFRSGDVQTTHPVAGNFKTNAAVPPAPAAIKALLPRLADLPAAAAVEATTIAELKKSNTELRKEPDRLRNEILRLRDEMSVLQKEQRVEQVPYLSEENRKRLGRLQVDLKLADQVLEALIADAQVVPTVNVPAKLPANWRQQSLPPPPKVRPADLPLGTPSNRTRSEVETQLGKCERAILQVLSQFPEGCQSGKLTLLAGYSWTGSFRNCLSALRTLGFIEGSNGDVMRTTHQGLAQGPFEQLPTGAALWHYWLNHPRFGKCERSILEALGNSVIEGLPATLLCSSAGYEWTGSFRNCLSALRTAGVIVGKNSENMRLSPELADAAAQS